MLPTCRVHCAIFDNDGTPIQGATATGEPADTARVAAGDADPVADAAALETVAGNYEQCREYIEQVRGWQRWWGEVSSRG